MKDTLKNHHSFDDADMVLPPEAVEVAFLTVREVIGQKGMDTLLRYAGFAEYEGRATLPPEEKVTFGDIGRLTQAMVDLYGRRGATAILQRAGRVQFRTWREAYPTAIGSARFALRALPARARPKVVLSSVALAARQIAHVQCNLDQDDEYYYFETYQCPYCSTVEAEWPFCRTAVGALSELAAWACDGKRFQVEETHCRAMGHPTCRFAISKTPLDE